MKVEIYGKEQCPHCVEALNMAKENTDDISMLKVGVDYELPELFERIGNPIRQFPQVFVDNVYIGNHKALENHIKSLKPEVNDKIEDGDLDDLEL